MSVALYSSDLQDVISEMPAITNWTALGGGASGLVAPETDFFIQGANCISKAGWSTATKGAIFLTGSGVNVPTGKAVFFWIYFWAPNSMAVEVSGGMQALIGSSAAAYKQWYVRGSDTQTYGGWVCVPVDPTITADVTTGSPTATTQSFGAQVNVPAGGPSKGQPLGVDAIRYGRDFTCVSGDSGNGYATFAGAATYNDNINRRFGQFQTIDGGYLWQGRFLFGHSTASVDFRDSYRSILVARTTKVGSTFNTLEVVNAASNIALTGVNVTALGTVSRGNWVNTDNARVVKDSCTFTDMGTFVYRSSSSLGNTTYRRCNLITQGTASFTKCTFDQTNDATRAMLANNPSTISQCTFISAGTKHGMEINTAGTYTFSANVFTGYAATNGSTGNEAVYNNSGGAVTLNITNGGGTPSVRNGSGATTTVSNATSYSLTGIQAGSEVTIVKSSDGTVLFHVESSAGGTETYSYGYVSDTPVDVLVMSLAYEPLNFSDTLRSSASSVPVQQTLERNYSNPL